MSFTCAQCRANLDDDLVVPGADIWSGVPVHLHTAGPRHGDLEVHPVYPGRDSLYTQYGPITATFSPSATFESDPVGATDVTLWADVSKYQLPVNNSYAHPFLSYKASQSTTEIDQNCHPNTVWGDHNSGPGLRMVGHQGYLVWYPGNEAAQARLFSTAVLAGPYFAWMLDVESWSGSITGDHSVQLVQLAEAMADLFGAQRGEVYGNQGDLDTIFPTRPHWLKVHKARYSATPPSQPFDSWQYSDGGPDPVPAGYPRSSAPFGPCDHNVYRSSVAAFQIAYALTPPAPPPPDPPDPPEEDMPALVYVDVTGSNKGEQVALMGGPGIFEIVDPAIVAALQAEKTIPGPPGNGTFIPQATYLKWTADAAARLTAPDNSGIETQLAALLQAVQAIPAGEVSGSVPTAVENAEATVDLLAQRTAPPA